MLSRLLFLLFVACLIIHPGSAYANTFDKACADNHIQLSNPNVDVVDEHICKILADEITRRWQFPKQKVTLSETLKPYVGIAFTLDGQGNLTQPVTITDSSGSNTIDASVIKAVQTAAPFQTVAFFLNNTSLEVTYQFPTHQIKEFQALYETQRHLSSAKHASLRTFYLQNENSSTINVYVQVHPTHDAKLQQAVKSALNEWNRALEGRLHYQFVSQSEKAHIEIRWISRSIDPFIDYGVYGTHATKAVGVTQSQIGKAKVEVAFKPSSPQVTQGILLHELGHALGILSHSPNTGDIMTTSLSKMTKSHEDIEDMHLSAKDIEAIRRLYSDHWQPGENVYQATSSQWR